MTTLLPLGHFAPLLVLAAAILGYARPGRRPAHVHCWPKLPRLASLVLAVFRCVATGHGRGPDHRFWRVFLLRLERGQAQP